MGGNIAWRRDRNAITFFSRKDGTKIRLAWGSYEKATWPELVDIKITDYCPIGCSFCYQDSTLFGKHASWDNLLFIVEELAKHKVFECALGGGETTDHPRFIELLREFRRVGVVPNFTTKVPAAVRRMWPEIQDLIGGFAYSAETAGQVISAAKLFKGVVPPDAVSLHYVMGLGDRDHFEEYLRAANGVGYRVTLLGYKTTGRGKDVVPHAYPWWVETVSFLVDEGVCPNLSIDTPLAADYDGLMPIPSTHYHTREGAFSMYVDAVALTMGASSFDEKEILQPFDSDWVKRYKAL